MILNGIISEPVINTDAAAEPVLLAEAKTYMEVSHVVHDALITAQIKAARQMLEKYTGRYFKAVNITIRFKNELGFGALPYKANGAIVYKDPYGVTVTDYNLEYEYDGIYSATYDTGYTTGVNAIPEDLRQAILMQVAFMYLNRGDNNQAGRLSEQAKALAANYRVLWI